jgi:hypothetical protein
LLHEDDPNKLKTYTLTKINSEEAANVSRELKKDVGVLSVVALCA